MSTTEDMLSVNTIQSTKTAFGVMVHAFHINNILIDQQCRQAGEVGRVSLKENGVGF